MLRPKPHLLIWLYARSLPATLVALPIALTYVLVWTEPILWRTPWIWTFVFVHALAIALLTQRFALGATGFLYTRGFSRDTLWAHVVLAQLLAIITVWLPVALLVWTSLRSMFQDGVLANPWFPFTWSAELAVPWGWLGGYMLLLAAFHYAAVRRWQPTRDRAAGLLIAAGTVAVGLTLMAEGFHAVWYGWLTLGALTLCVVTLMIGAWRLHRRLEVHV